MSPLGVIEVAARKRLGPAWRYAKGLRRQAIEGWYRAKEARQDRRLGISTYVPPVTTAESQTGPRSAYEALNYKGLELIDRRLELGADDVLCDAGCGMGRVLCFFARRPLKACVGLEYDPVLADAARDNIARLRDPRSPATVVTGDAADYDYSQVTALVMYNPFGEDTMRRLLEGLSRSLATHPRRIQIAYAHPRQKAVFDAFPVFIERESFLAPYVEGQMTITVWATSP